MIKLALIGKNISHSKSQLMYESILKKNISYDLLDIQEESDLPLIQDLFKKYDGVSITTPYKKSYLNSVNLEDEVKKLHAINCMKKVGNSFYATNTDYLAMEEILLDKRNSYPSIVLLVLGNGVMAQVLIAICNKYKIPFSMFTRSGDKDFTQREIVNLNPDPKAPLLVINCCSRGYVFKNKTKGNVFFWDLNYSYQEHDFLKEKFKSFEDGLYLLERQAHHALVFWSIIK